ncbi:hypothetical protein Verru16b_03247 [Lacunisphaera limnophila]|uniref:Uncharacterized protein n=1 Tax=Lacunisphaera limnophila TaxID=1838286 RepID=A0A1D8AZ27_9BACT|nr:hypothetical protein [Lacunisphaera limnophila]AOS46150.1 hypothetical protein Verru16b_03247 [Lacunisphaera limnophila]
MKCSRLSLLLVVLTLPGLFSLARGTTIIAPDFDQLVNSADYVVRATVKSVTSEWRQNPDNPRKPYIGTQVELEVLEVISGTPPSPLILDLVGGRIGDKQLVVDGAPRFEPGQESILFIQGNGRQIVPLVGMKHGHYPVRRDPRTGDNQVMRSGGKFLYHEAEVALPTAAASAAPARDPRARPLNTSEFATRIRSHVKPHDRERHQ